MVPRTRPREDTSRLPPPRSAEFELAAEVDPAELAAEVDPVKIGLAAEVDFEIPAEKPLPWFAKPRRSAVRQVMTQGNKGAI